MQALTRDDVTTLHHMQVGIADRNALRLLPLRAGDAEAMIAETHAAKPLRGVRGGPPAYVESLARCLYALADLAYANRSLIAEIDLNPIKVLPQGQGCVVVDALIAPLVTDKD